MSDPLLHIGEAISLLKRGEISLHLMKSLRRHMSFADSLVQSVCGDASALRVLLEDNECCGPCVEAIAVGLGGQIWDKETRLNVVCSLAFLMDSVLGMLEASIAGARSKQKLVVMVEQEAFIVPQPIRTLCECVCPRIGSILAGYCLLESNVGTRLDFAVADCFLSLSALASYCQMAVDESITAVLNRLRVWYGGVAGAGLIVTALGHLVERKWFRSRPDVWSLCVANLARKSAHLEQNGKQLIKVQMKALKLREQVDAEVALVLLCLLLGRLGPKRRRKATPRQLRSIVMDRLSLVPSCAVALVVDLAEPAVRDICLEQLLESELLAQSPKCSSSAWLALFVERSDVVVRLAKRNPCLQLILWVQRVNPLDFALLLELLKRSESAQGVLTSEESFWKACLSISVEMWSKDVAPLASANWKVFSSVMFSQIILNPEEARLITIASALSSRWDVSVVGPMLIERMQNQERLTLELLDDKDSAGRVRKLLFDRLAPLLVIRVLPTIEVECVELLAPLLIERMRALCEFDQCRRLAAEAVATKVPVKLSLTLTFAEFDSVCALEEGEEKSSATKAFVYCWCGLVMAHARDMDDDQVGKLLLASFRAHQFGEELGCVLLKTRASAVLQSFSRHPAEVAALLILFFSRFKSESSELALAVIDALVAIPASRER